MDYCGQSIIQKTNWLIDYPNEIMEISNNGLSDETFTDIEINRKDGSPYTFIIINGKKYKAIIDLGSTRSLSIPKDSKLAEHVIKRYRFEDIEKDNYTIGGGLQNIKQKTGHIPLVKLGGIENTDVEAAIKQTTNIRIGSGFFKHYLLYIDNTNGNYKIKKVN